MSQPYYEGLSETVLANPSVKLDFEHEYELFFAKLASTDSARCSKIMEISNRLPIAEGSRTFVAIPCHAKEQNLKRTLEQYCKQTCFDFEILICINAGPEIDELDFSSRAQVLEAEIAEIKSQFPKLKVHSFREHFSDNVALGNVRSLLTEIACTCAKQRNQSDPIVISNDSDCVKLKSDYVETTIRRFLDRSMLEYAAGRSVFYSSPSDVESASRQAPELWIREMIIELMDLFNQKKIKSYSSVNITGANTAFRASAYLASGGYDCSVHYGEDGDIYHRFIAMRCRSTEQYVDDLTLKNVQSSARRLLNSVLEGTKVFLTEDDFTLSLGSDLNEQDLIRKYQNNPHLLQVDDIKAAAKGDLDAQLKIKQRVEQLLRMSLLCKKQWHASTTALVLKILDCMGIVLHNQKNTSNPLRNWIFVSNREGNIEDIQNIQIDLAKSQRALRYLYSYYGCSPS
ncbi:MAG: hypothetical protein WC843_05885 [Candidatus Gracilibacteria bacterium]|jgi:hypothetical protein